MLGEKLPAGQRDDGDGDALLAQLRLGSHCQRDLAAGGDQRGLTGAIGFGEHIAAAGRAVLAGIAAQRGQGLTAQRQHRGTIGAAQRHFPAFRRFHRIRRAEEEGIGHAAQ